MLNELVKLAKFLDENNEKEEAAKIYNMLGQLKSSIMHPIYDRLCKIADNLDSHGFYKEADEIGEFIKNSDVYDSKKHMNDTIRKKDKNIDDVENRKEHHVETFKHNPHTMSMRYCPEHIGVMLARVGENTYQCPKDNKVFDWENGWVDHNGNRHPGGSISGQTAYSDEYCSPHRIFDKE